MPRISICKSSSKFCCSIGFLNLDSHSSFEESLFHGPLHILKLKSLPLSIKWVFTFAMVHKVRPLHLAQGQFNYSMHIANIFVLFKPKAYYPYVFVFLGDKTVEFL